MGAFGGQYRNTRASLRFIGQSVVKLGVRAGWGRLRGRVRPCWRAHRASALGCQRARTGAMSTGPPVDLGPGPEGAMAARKGASVASGVWWGRRGSRSPRRGKRGRWARGRREAVPTLPEKAERRSPECRLRFSSIARCEAEQSIARYRPGRYRGWPGIASGSAVRLADRQREDVFRDP